jgi:hypothetical protein
MLHKAYFHWRGFLVFWCRFTLCRFGRALFCVTCIEPHVRFSNGKWIGKKVGKLNCPNLSYYPGTGLEGLCKTKKGLNTYSLGPDHSKYET